MTAEELKAALTHEWAQSATWALAFIGVCVLVGLGKIKPETIEMLLMGLAARQITGPTKGKTDAGNS